MAKGKKCGGLVKKHAKGGVVKGYQKGGVIESNLPTKEQIKNDPELRNWDKYNTKLTSKEKAEFEDWKIENNINEWDRGAYDIQGYWKDFVASGKGDAVDSDGHRPDTYKKPNHFTFSNQSKYHGKDGNYGGNWTEKAGFQPSKQQLEEYGPEYFNQRFSEEPNRPEHLDMSRYKTGKNQPSLLVYKNGGKVKGYEQGGFVMDPFGKPAWVDDLTQLPSGQTAMSPEQIEQAGLTGEYQRRTNSLEAGDYAMAAAKIGLTGGFGAHSAKEDLKSKTGNQNTKDLLDTIEWVANPIPGMGNKKMKNLLQRRVDKRNRRKNNEEIRGEDDDKKEDDEEKDDFLIGDVALAQRVENSFLKRGTKEEQDEGTGSGGDSVYEGTDLEGTEREALHQQSGDMIKKIPGVGQIYQIGEDLFGKKWAEKRAEAEAIDPITGKLKDPGKAKRWAIAGSLLNPSQAYMTRRRLNSWGFNAGDDYVKEIEKGEGFKDGGQVMNKKKGYQRGGKIVGPGTGKSDSIPANLKHGSFVVPAENSGIAEKLRNQFLGGNQTAQLKSGGKVPVKVSNGEHVFNPQEVALLQSKGVNLNALAPNAESGNRLHDGGYPGHTHSDSMSDSSLGVMSQEQIQAYMDTLFAVDSNKAAQIRQMTDSRYKKELQEINDDKKKLSKLKREMAEIYQKQEDRKSSGYYVSPNKTKEEVVLEKKIKRQENIIKQKEEEVEIYKDPRVYKRLSTGSMSLDKNEFDRIKGGEGSSAQERIAKETEEATPLVKKMYEQNMAKQEKEATRPFIGDETKVATTQKLPYNYLDSFKTGEEEELSRPGDPQTDLEAADDIVALAEKISKRNSKSQEKKTKETNKVNEGDDSNLLKSAELEKINKQSDFEMQLSQDESDADAQEELDAMEEFNRDISSGETYDDEGIYDTQADLDKAIEKQERRDKRKQTAKNVGNFALDNAGTILGIGQSLIGANMLRNRDERPDQFVGGELQSAYKSAVEEGQFGLSGGARSGLEKQIEQNLAATFDAIDKGAGSRNSKNAAKLAAFNKANEAVTSGIAPLEEQLRVNKLSMIGPLASRIQDVQTSRQKDLQNEFDQNSAAYASLVQTGIKNIIGGQQFRQIQELRAEGQQPTNIYLGGTTT